MATFTTWVQLVEGTVPCLAKLLPHALRELIDLVRLLRHVHRDLPSYFKRTAQRHLSVTSTTILLSCPKKNWAPILLVNS